jgi:tetratricopeptide (TPR) repeat protein
MQIQCAQGCLCSGIFGLSIMRLGTGHPHPKIFGNFENQFPKFLARSLFCNATSSCFPGENLWLHLFASLLDSAAMCCGGESPISVTGQAPRASKIGKDAHGEDVHGEDAQVDTQSHLRENSTMQRMLKVLGIATLAIMWIAPAARAQVPEKIPSPPIDPDWTYISPGPAKCVEIGNVYLHKGALGGALSRFQEAVKDDPHYAPAYLGLGKVYERMKEKQKALDAYERYLDELPSAKDAKNAADAQRAVARLKKELWEK